MEKTIQIYQVRNKEKRIQNDIFEKIGKLYRIELHKINIDELHEINDKRVHILIFDSIEVEEIKYTNIEPLQNNNKHLYTMVVLRGMTEKKAIKLFDKHIDYLCEGNLSDGYIIGLLKTILKRKSEKYFVETMDYFKNIKVDSILREVYISDKLVETSNKEFKLIKYLVRNHEDFKKKIDVFKSIWGYEEDTSRILDQYLHRIKKKIGDEVIVVKDKVKGLKLL
ncbi:winged helix-turn-helix domain-containing protein [Mycoplasma todarodis]|uniref:OmpR/PhoB-type domain-containing protein n=1 Tax=Mycoplasma todarodis TaxID=1937191 RepID=A0A4R0XVW9_9MOLU|nr:winged helix-turn-helix domain-containing protein [Mycoplasma todarodis]TCG11101.1 hypothetical protein C4B25_02310 [Mycoplasma todarodis]